MDKDPLPPIPTPPAQRWREFRIQVLPLIVFAIVVFAIISLWRTYVQPSMVVGEVESLRSDLSSLVDGQVVEVRVRPFDTVTRGQVLARVSPMDPALQEATLAQTAADLHLMKLRLDVDKTRNLSAYSQLKLDLITERLNLGIAQARLRLAENELKRAKELYEAEVAPLGIGSRDSPTGYEVALRDRDALVAEIDQRTKAIAELQKDLKAMETRGVIQIAETDPVIEQAIRAQQEVLRRTAAATEIKAPFDGVVSRVYHQPGEKVLRGDPIVRVESRSASYIIGYIRQPIERVPTTNDTVTIRTRSTHRRMAKAPIVRVGSQMERINPLLLSPDGARQEVGLPILIALPPNLKVLPGEYVELSINYTRP